MRVCVRVELLFCLSLRHRTIFYIGTLLILMACVHARSCRCEYMALGVVLLVQMGCWLMYVRVVVCLCLYAYRFRDTFLVAKLGE